MSSPTISFDIFDTVLTRTWAEPHDLFVGLGERLSQQHLSAATPLEFAAHRFEAERRARAAAPNREVLLVEIYSELSTVMHWNETQAHTAANVELAFESESVRPIRPTLAVVEAARQRAGRIIFLSDTYLPSSAIRSWLERANVFREGDRLFVSGEARDGKGTGALFRNARNAIGGNFQHWEHTGDNPVSDGDAARVLGISATIKATSRLTSHERCLRGSGDFASPWRSLLAGAARLARLDFCGAADDQRERTLWDVGASVAGPLFWGFTDWSLEQARRRDIQELYFLARGGQIFHRIAEQIVAARNIPIRCRYVLTSRIAFAGAADQDNPMYLRQLADAPLAQHSVRQAFANVGLSLPEAEEIAGIPRHDWDRNLGPDERKAVADWILAPERIELVRAALRERSQRAKEHVAGVGLSRSIRTGLVDTGWMGTIQRNVEYLLGELGAPAHLTGFYLGLSSVREFDCAGEMIGYTNTFRRLSLRRETTHLILLELMARGTHGPLLGFDRVDDQVTPRLGKIEPGTIAEVRLFQEAVLAFVSNLLTARVDEFAPNEGAARVVIANYLDFFHHPSIDEVLTLGRTPHSDQMLEWRHTVLCAPMTLREVLIAIRSFTLRPPGWWLAGQAKLGFAPLIYGYIAFKRLKWCITTWCTGKQD